MLGMPKNVVRLTPEWRGAIAKGQTHHGHYANGKKSPTYNSWYNMKYRCKKRNGWADHGITVCEQWELFENFLADMGERPEGKTLDRIDPYGDYEPGNCRWATPLEQRRNRRNSVGAQ